MILFVYLVSGCGVRQFFSRLASIFLLCMEASTYTMAMTAMFMKQSLWPPGKEFCRVGYYVFLGDKDDMMQPFGCNIEGLQVD